MQMISNKGVARWEILLVTAIVVGLILNILISSLNRIPTLDKGITRNWNNLLNLYQQRADLIPNMVVTVKAHAKPDNQVLAAVLAAHAKVSRLQVSEDILTSPEAFKSFEQNQQALSSAIARMLLMVEHNPALQANTDYLAMQERLASIENHIDRSLRGHIEIVSHFNHILHTIPNRWLAPLFYPEMKDKQNFMVPESR